MQSNRALKQYAATAGQDFNPHPSTWSNIFVSNFFFKVICTLLYALSDLVLCQFF